MIASRIETNGAVLERDWPALVPTTSIMDHAPAPSEVHPSAEAGLTLGDLVGFVRRRWWLLLGPGVLAAAVVWVFVSLQPPMYRAMASLLLSPEPVELKSLAPISLAPEAYQRLLESPVVIGETRQRLREQGVLGNERLQVGKNLSSQILISPARRRGEAPQASLVQLVALCSTPELAQAAANTWAEVFREQAEQLSRQGILEPIRRLEDRYPELDERLAELEQRRVAQQDAAGLARLQLNGSWRARLEDHRAETERLESEHQEVTRERLNSAISEARLVSRRAHLEARQGALGQLETRLAKLDREAEVMTQRLQATKAQLAGTPRIVETRKSVNDDTVWKLVVGQDASAPQSDVNWQTLQLVQQEPNPLYEELSTRAALLEIDLLTTLAPRESLEAQRTALSEEVDRLDTEVQAARTLVDAVRRARESGLELLSRQRSDGLDALSEAWLEERSAHERQAELELEQVEREIDRLQKEAEMLLPGYLDGRLLSAQLAAPAVSIGIEASKPLGATQQAPLFKSVLAFLAGNLAGLLLALGLELRRWNHS